MVVWCLSIVDYFSDVDMHQDDALATEAATLEHIITVLREEFQQMGTSEDAAKAHQVFCAPSRLSVCDMTMSHER